MSNKLIKYGFILAAMMNFSVLIFSKWFTNTAINHADPVVMSNFGLLMIAVWGAAYFAASQINANIKWLTAVFAVEKLIYGLVWINWLQNNALSDVYEQDLLAGLFYSIYGINDLAFMLFFIWVFFKLHKNNSALG